MGLLIDLIKTIAEAIEEARAPKGLPPPARPRVPTPASDAAMPRVPVKLPAAAGQLDRARERAKDESEARAKSAALKRAEQTARQLPTPRRTVGGERLALLLRQPQTLRDLVVMKEILDRPLALRRDRR